MTNLEELVGYHPLVMSVLYSFGDNVFWELFHHDSWYGPKSKNYIYYTNMGSYLSSYHRRIYLDIFYDYIILWKVGAHIHHHSKKLRYEELVDSLVSVLSWYSMWLFLVGLNSETKLCDSFHHILKRCWFIFIIFLNLTLEHSNWFGQIPFSLLRDPFAITLHWPF